MDLAAYLTDLAYLTNIDSGTTDGHAGIAETCDFFEARFRALGWHTERHSPSPLIGENLVCTWGDPERCDLLMIGHLDTVFSCGTAAARPFRIEGNLAYGPGVADMKNGALLMYYLALGFSAEVLEKLNIVMVFNADEETGSVHSRKVYEKYAKCARYAFIYECATTDGACCSARKGGLGYTVQFGGKAGHCGYAFTNGAKSAVHEMGRWIYFLTEMQNKELGTSVNIGVAKGGTKGNVVADRAEMTIDIRFLENSERARFEDAIEELKKGARERGIEVSMQGRCKLAWENDDSQLAYLAHVSEICRSAGVPFSHRMRGGLSDANIIAQYGAICLDGLAPMGDHCHTDEECMFIDTVERFYALSCLLIRDLAESISVSA